MLGVIVTILISRVVQFRILRPADVIAVRASCRIVISEREYARVRARNYEYLIIPQLLSRA